MDRIIVAKMKYKIIPLQGDISIIRIRSFQSHASSYRLFELCYHYSVQSIEVTLGDDFFYFDMDRWYCC